MSDGENSTTNTETSSEHSEKLKYGGLFLLGCNGCLPNGDRKRKRSKFILEKRGEPNGIKKARHYTVKSSKSSKTAQNSDVYTISYALSKDEIVNVEYVQDKETDMFQIGRCLSDVIDFIVLDKYVGVKGEVHQSTVSRFACRIIAERSNPKNVWIYASGFDDKKHIFLGERALKWKDDDQSGIDALTTNGVLISHPGGIFCGAECEAGVWREVSVCGNIFSVRGTRSAQERGRAVEGTKNLLQDGSLIDLCGATLLWRSSQGLEHCVTKEYIEGLVNKLNSDQLPNSVQLNTLVIPRKKNSESFDGGGNKTQPYVFLNCGHVHGEHVSKQEDKSLPSKCHSCNEVGPAEKLCMGMEPAFYIDNVTDPIPSELFAFNPCGHITTEKTVKFWSKAAVPHGTSAYQAICPFCATELQGYPGYIRLIFKVD